jgi:hypothetical protein
MLMVSNNTDVCAPESSSSLTFLLLFSTASNTICSFISVKGILATSRPFEKVTIAASFFDKKLGTPIELQPLITSSNRRKPFLNGMNTPKNF